MLVAQADATQPQGIEIRPEVTMLSVLRHLNYKPWFAIGEFIDNAIQSFLANEAALKALHGDGFTLLVKVDVDATDDGEIVVTDNAAGISEQDFPRAFRPAQIPVDRNGLSEFGMGMKSAACWFARNWSVRTKALGETVERTIKFDVKHIVDNKIEKLQPELHPMDASAHHTVVVLRGLHHSPKGQTIGKIKKHLASIYRIFIREKRMVLLFDGEELKFEEVPVLIAPRYTSAGVAGAGDLPVEWKKEISLDFGQGQRVTGFAALRAIGSTPLAGFALFRRDRLIEGSHDETYRPPQIFKQPNSYPYQRLFGELHIEGFEVSHTKDGFRWEEYEDEFLEFLKDAVEGGELDLVAQAENYRSLPTKKSIEKKAATATASVATYLEQNVAPLLVDARQHPVQPAPLATEIASSPLQASERVVEIDDSDHNWIITIRTSIDPATQPWVSVAKRECAVDGSRERKLTIDLALAHPFSAQFIGANNENIELFLRMSSMLCISLVLAEDLTSEPPQTVLHFLNSLLREAQTRNL